MGTTTRKPRTDYPRPHRLSLSLSEAEMATVRRAAEIRGEPPATWARDQLLERARFAVAIVGLKAKPSR